MEKKVDRRTAMTKRMLKDALRAYRVVCVWLNKKERESPREIAEILSKAL